MWKKQGLVYCPDGSMWWSKSFAILPTPDVLEDRLRVYFGTVDDEVVGRVGYVDLALDDPSRIIDVGKEPSLDVGELGCFDDSSVTPSCVVEHYGTRYLYYIGWQNCVNVPHMMFIGLANDSGDGWSWQRLSAVPILDRTEQEPFWRTAIYVRASRDWPIGIKMTGWYSSGLSWWSKGESRPYPSYGIRVVRSRNGIDWQGDECFALTPEAESGEFGFGRPWVVKDDIYKMWYSIRTVPGPTYRIGYAESADGSDWERKDHLAGIDVSDEGWDSEMVCYTAIVDLPIGRIMLYCGNGHGKGGFGWAIWEP